jgi:predicted nuclease of predicted toxin-antitoxin system
VSRLFIELYLDEDVDVLVADLVRAKSFLATTTRGDGQVGNNDEEQLAYAVSQQKTLLTHNRTDFEQLNRTTQDWHTHRPELKLRAQETKGTEIP